MLVAIVSSRSAALLTLFGALVSPAFAVPVEPMVATPDGLRPQANIHAIPIGGSISHIGSDVHILAADGTVTHIARNAGTRSATAALAKKTKREASGWVAWTGWLNTGLSPVSTFTSTWSVPPVPVTYNSQLLYLFNSFFSYDAKAIIQPVLQYGVSPAGGAQGHWAVASWYVTATSGFHSSLVNVSVGQVLNGSLSLLAQNGSTYDYSSEFVGIPGTLLVVNNGPLLPGVSKTLETYGATRKSDYPTGTTVFSNTDLKLESGAAPGFVWNITNDAADGHTAQVNVAGATNGEVTIVY
ncbi:hypothetical protein DFH08DRAFT_966750 [Mycena albidolilacea]|uniref:Uncharacterized protein n=1 Tax=Mycena albidolilacea TaxID=1033008 RepID=A0AAD6ZNG3_9AGAR|nr:hypothetical protein DFH08DRAFT_966750 [Mycena albidolilacea]